MVRTLLTLTELAVMAGPYFASNTDVCMLLGLTHNGAFYRPENRSYAEHEARVNASEVVEVLLDDHRTAVAPRPSSAEMRVAPADGVVKEGIALVADGQLSEAPLVGDGSGQSLPAATADEQPAAPAPVAPEITTPKKPARKPATPKNQKVK